MVCFIILFSLLLVLQLLPLILINQSTAHLCFHFQVVLINSVCAYIQFSATEVFQSTFRCVRKIAKTTISFVMSVRPSVRVELLDFH
jgi:hypothetical protein